MITYDRDIYFGKVRASLFGGSLDQGQVDGQNAILHAWERWYPDGDARWAGYCLATAMWETASTLLPIEEYGKGAGHPYGEVDPETGQTYYGRGFVQLTWRDNYARADRELHLGRDKSCEWHADNALQPRIAGAIMFKGMDQGWFRADDVGPQTLGRYFSGNYDEPFVAREIINGDKYYTVDWDPRTIGEIIAGYYIDFTAALNAAKQEEISV